MLLVAAVAVVVVPTVYHPGVAGRAAAAPLPGPPAVGSCLLLQDAVPALVDCAEPHDVEVTAGVDADATSPTSAQCQARAADYVAPIQVGDWEVPLAYDVGVLPAPPGERLGARGWQACTIRPSTHERFTGSVRGMTLATYRGVLFGSCSDSYAGPVLRCDSPHETELLGMADIVYADPQLNVSEPYSGFDPSASPLPDSVTADLTGRCTTLAAELTAVTDPTYGGQLEIRMSVRGVYPLDRLDTVQIYLACMAVAPTDRPLSGSVIGLGMQPLPFG